MSRLKSKRELLLLLFLCLFGFLSGLLFWHHYQSETAFKRAYEEGTTYDQLDALMNTKRYVKDVRKAGYQIDQSDVFMYDRIPWLTTKGKPEIKVYSPDSDKTIMVIFHDNIDNQSVTVSFILDRSLKITYQEFEADSTGDIVNVDKETQKQYALNVKKQLQTLVKSVYQEIYHNK